jgi:hypothetical protein
MSVLSVDAILDEYGRPQAVFIQSESRWSTVMKWLLMCIVDLDRYNLPHLSSFVLNSNLGILVLVLLVQEKLDKDSQIQKQSPQAPSYPTGIHRNISKIE